MTRLPAAMGRESTTGTNEPSTHSSCSCASNRAKARPWSDSRTWRWTRASKEGLATAPGAPPPRAPHCLNPPDGEVPAEGGDPRHQPQRAREHLLLAQHPPDPRHGEHAEQGTGGEGSEQEAE